MTKIQRMYYDFETITIRWFLADVAEWSTRCFAKAFPSGAQVRILPSATSVSYKSIIRLYFYLLFLFQKTGHSSVGRATDCKSVCPWFDPKWSERCPYRLVVRRLSSKQKTGVRFSVGATDKMRVHYFYKPVWLRFIPQIFLKPALCVASHTRA